jgi:hypothetical protein
MRASSTRLARIRLAARVCQKVAEPGSGLRFQSAEPTGDVTWPINWEKPARAPPPSAGGRLRCGWKGEGVPRQGRRIVILNSSNCSTLEDCRAR